MESSVWNWTGFWNKEFFFKAKLGGNVCVQAQVQREPGHVCLTAEQFGCVDSFNVILTEDYSVGR